MSVVGLYSLFHNTAEVICFSSTTTSQCETEGKVLHHPTVMSYTYKISPNDIVIHDNRTFNYHWFCKVRGRTKYVVIMNRSTEGKFESPKNELRMNLIKFKDLNSIHRSWWFWTWLTHTTHSSGVELKVRWTVAQVAARCVHTESIDAVDWISTLIYVCRAHKHTLRTLWTC